MVVMQGISIHDKNDHGLTFDLAELLRALGPMASEALWRPKTVITYVTSDDQPIAALEWQPTGGQWTLGRDLLQLSRLRQVIDGVLESVLAAEAQPWVVLRAVDSSWWEAYSDDAHALEALKRTFRDIRPALYTPEHPATDY
jgi:hypothetical protein